MDFDCNCTECRNDDAPDTHDICECYACHESGCHESAVEWSAICQWCDEILVDEAINQGGC